MKASTLLFFLIVLSTVFSFETSAQRIVGEPTQRPPIEPAEDILRRRGHILDGTGSSKSQIDAAKPPAVRLREEARRLEAQFGAFQESGGVYKYRREDVVIENPVRIHGGETIVLAPAPPDDWIHISGARVLNALTNGILASCLGTAMLLKGHPSELGLVDGATISGWFRITHDRYPYTAVNGASKTVVVADYGQLPSREEARDAINSLMASWRSRIDVLNAEADQIETAAKSKREDAVRKFREEQEAKRNRLVLTNSN